MNAASFIGGFVTCFFAVIVCRVVVSLSKRVQKPQTSGSLIPLGSSVRHKDGLFESARVVAYDCADSTIRVSLVQSQGGIRTIVYYWFSEHEVERVVDTEQARGLIDGK